MKTLAQVLFIVIVTILSGAGTYYILSDSTTIVKHEFSCQEDEVIGYAPRFGPDTMGCIHIDEFRK